MREMKPTPARVSSVIMGVSTAPGHTVFTRIPLPPSSRASARDTPRSPHFEAE